MKIVVSELEENFNGWYQGSISNENDFPPKNEYQFHIFVEVPVKFSYDLETGQVVFINNLTDLVKILQFQFGADILSVPVNRKSCFQVTLRTSTLKIKSAFGGIPIEETPSRP